VTLALHSVERQASSRSWEIDIMLGHHAFTPSSILQDASEEQFKEFRSSPMFFIGAKRGYKEEFHKFKPTQPNWLLHEPASPRMTPSSATSNLDHVGVRHRTDLMQSRRMDSLSIFHLYRLVDVCKMQIGSSLPRTELPERGHHYPQPRHVSIISLDGASSYVSRDPSWSGSRRYV
jgi:hypothetical protein